MVLQPPSSLSAAERVRALHGQTLRLSLKKKDLDQCAFFDGVAGNAVVMT